MKQKFTLIKVNGEITVIEVDSVGALKKMQDLVGGLIEIVKVSEGRVLIINEEGKIHGLPVNNVASMIFDSDTDYIVGDVLLTDYAEFCAWDDVCV